MPETMTSLDRIYSRNLTPIEARRCARVCELNRNSYGARLYADVAEALEAAQRLRDGLHLPIQRA